MIITVKKYLFWGSHTAVAQFFLGAQKLGFIEFTSDVRQVAHKNGDLDALVLAMKELKRHPPIAQASGASLECCPRFFAKEIAAMMAEREKLLEDEVHCNEELAVALPFGDFDYEDVIFIRNNTEKSFLFCQTKPGTLSKVVESESVIHVSTHHDLSYLIFFGNKEDLPVDCSELDVFRSVNEIQEQIRIIRERRNEIDSFFRYAASYLPCLRNELMNQLDQESLKRAQGHVKKPLGNELFVVEGWVPESHFKKLAQFIEPFPIFFEEVAPDFGEKVPTYMENSGFNQVGEDLVNVYDTPAPEDKDPSAWVFWAFLLFFSMIISDAGYALFYMALTIYLYQKMPTLKKGFFLLLGSLSLSCFIWGVLSGSLWGINFSPDSWMNTFSIYSYLVEKKVDYHLQKGDATYQDWIHRYPQLKQKKNVKEIVHTPINQNGNMDYPVFNQTKSALFLEISLILGMVHIITALLRYAVSSPSNFGWILCVVGGYLYCPYVLGVSSLFQVFTPVSLDVAAGVGEQFMWIGILFAVLVALLQRGFYGLEELTKVVQIFADILSYLRIYALALAGGIMAQTFNSMGLDNGIFLGAIIIFAGHSINFLLSTMGGVIHGLRLNFIEWYHYCFNGEGRLLRPLKKINTKQE